MAVTAPVSWGELLDKISILDIKREKLTDSAALANVENERTALVAVRDQDGMLSPEARALCEDLRTVNQALWDIEDEIRDCERQNDFGDRFVELARSVYITNDKRADLKRQLNILLRSGLVEEKSYAAY